MGVPARGLTLALWPPFFPSHSFSNFSENFFKSQRIIALAAILRFEKRLANFGHRAAHGRLKSPVDITAILHVRHHG